MTIQKYLECATCHIKPETNNWLKSVANVPDFSSRTGMTVASYENGFFITVPRTNEYSDAVPDDLRFVLDIARQQACTVLQLDTNGWRLLDMPMFDW